MLTLSEMQSLDRFQFWKHFDDVRANNEDLIKNTIISKFSPARCRRKILLRFCKLNMPEKQSYIIDLRYGDVLMLHLF